MIGIKAFSQSAKKLLSGIAQQNNISQAKGEEAAFAFFTCALAIHYMKVNGYLTEKTDKLAFFEKCRVLSKTMPDFFMPIFEFETLDLPISKLFELLNNVDEMEFVNKPEVIGRIYQYYISDLKEEAFLLLQKNIRITKERLPAATQIFTPQWIVKYLIENSLCKLSGIRMGKWEYCIEKPDKCKDFDIKKTTLIDPCMGSGNMLLYAFDVFMDLYADSGIDSAEATESILQNNLFGLDIDEKAYRLSYFSLLMKAGSYNKNILGRQIDLNLCAIKQDKDYFKNAKELGSLIGGVIVPKGHTLEKQAGIMGGSFDVVVTNPPYMGRKSINATLADYLRKNYPESKSELYAAFIHKCIDMTKHGGICGMVTPHTWLFISSFSSLRKYVLENTAIMSVLHSGAATFEGISSFNALAAAFCLLKGEVKGPSTFIRLTDYLSAEEKQKNFHNPKNIFKVRQSEFLQMPGTPFVYMSSDSVRHAFAVHKGLGDYAPVRQGLATGDNGSFVKYWFEVDKNEIAFDCKSIQEFHKSGKKYAPYNKGGNHRKWYGGNEYVIAFDEASYENFQSRATAFPHGSIISGRG